MTWTPAPGNAGTYTDVTFFVSDGLHDISETTTLLIASTIAAPTFVRPADRTVREGDPVRIQLAATDPQGLPLTYSSNLLPPGGLLDPATGLVEHNATRPRPSRRRNRRPRKECRPL